MYLDCGHGYATVNIYENSTSRILKKGEFHRNFVFSSCFILKYRKQELKIEGFFFKFVFSVFAISKTKAWKEHIYLPFAYPVDQTLFSNAGNLVFYTRIADLPSLTKPLSHVQLRLSFSRIFLLSSSPSSNRCILGSFPQSTQFDVHIISFSSVAPSFKCMEICMHVISFIHWIICLMCHFIKLYQNVSHSTAWYTFRRTRFPLPKPYEPHGD